jgi:hypothetical protein
VIVSNWQIWLVAAIVTASSRSCSAQTAPAHRPTTSQTPVRGLDKGTMEMRTTSASAPSPICSVTASKLRERIYAPHGRP